jgi:hypothetical protein
MSAKASLPGIARRKTRVNALMPRQSIFFRKKMDARVKPAHDRAKTLRRPPETVPAGLIVKWLTSYEVSGVRPD